ncbi:MAG: hypothetical protein EXS31_09205 [Pedosphaera sp.]|nr:hypothetical protein [Pedosphaera sp.]
MKNLMCATFLLLLAAPLRGADLKIPINDTTHATLDRAERALRRGAFSEAIVATSSVIEADPKNVRALVLRGRANGETLQHDKAVADYDAALKLQSRMAGIHQYRGVEQFKLAKINEAIADFDKVLELDPSQAAQHWQRGIALYYAGRFEDGRKQFELHQTVNRNDVENATWHFLCTARSQGIEKARTTLIPIEGDARVPMKQIHALFAGKATAQEVLAAAEAGSPTSDELKNRLFYAHLYLGLYYAAGGNQKLTEDHITKAAGPYGQNHYMGDVARVHAQLLRSKTAPK